MEAQDLPPSSGSAAFNQTERVSRAREGRGCIGAEVPAEIAISVPEREGRPKGAAAFAVCWFDSDPFHFPTLTGAPSTNRAMAGKGKGFNPQGESYQQKEVKQVTSSTKEWVYNKADEGSGPDLLPGENTLGVSPNGNRVIVEVDKEPDKTPGGIILSEGAREKPFRATVLAVGRGQDLPDGRVIRPEVQVGDVIFYSQHAGVPYRHQGRELLILSCNDLLAIEGQE